MAIIAIDFDGTCVTHEYPKIGREIGAEPVLKALVENGNELVLNTMRSGKELNDAISWLRGKGIKIVGVNEYPTQKGWTKSSKTYAHLYIDDANLGCPLLYNPIYSDSPYVDWDKVARILLNLKLITQFQYDSF